MGRLGVLVGGAETINHGTIPSLDARNAALVVCLGLLVFQGEQWILAVAQRSSVEAPLLCHLAEAWLCRLARRCDNIDGRSVGVRNRRWKCAGLAQCRSSLSVFSLLARSRLPPRVKV